MGGGQRNLSSTHFVQTLQGLSLSTPPYVTSISLHAVGLWAGSLRSLSICFLLCKAGIIESILQGCCGTW